MADINLERVRARNIQGVSAPLLPPPIAPIPPGFSPLSSIAPATSNVMVALISTHQKTERLAARAALLFDAEATKTLAQLDKLAIEQAEELRKTAEAAASRKTWGTLSTVAQYVTGTGTVLLGVSLWQVPGGAVPGTALIASGVIGLGVRTLHDTQAIEAAVAFFTTSQELQQQIAHRIEMGAFFLEMGLGLAGGVGAWKSGALALAQINGGVAEKTLSAIFTGTNQALSIGGRIGQSHHQKKLSESQARFKELDTQKFLQEQALQDETKQMTKMIESTQADSLQKAVRAQEISLD